MKNFIKWLCKLFHIKPEIKYIETITEKEKPLPQGSLLIEADKIKIDDIEIGVE